MSQYRKYIDNVVHSPISHSDSQRSVRNTNRPSRSKDKLRLHTIKSKETFLTDTQASDYTKSSNECGPSKNLQSLHETIKNLTKENHQLKQELAGLKSSYYFNINQDKLKDLISENDRLKQQISVLKKKLDQSTIQRDYLERLNKNLKTQYSQVTRQILVLNKESSPKIDIQKSPRNSNKSIDFQDLSSKKLQRLSVKYLEQTYKSRNSQRSQESQEKLQYKSKQLAKMRQKQEQKMLKKSRSTSKAMQNQYFLGKGTKQESKKYKKGKKLQDE